MITRRMFLARGGLAVAGAAVAASAAVAPAYATHKNPGIPQGRIYDRLKDGSGEGTPDGHPQMQGEDSLRVLGVPIGRDDRLGLGVGVGDDAGVASNKRGRGK